MAKKKVGRPLFDGKGKKEVLSKLEEAFAFGASDEEACYYADISTSALYRYQEDNKEFREYKERLKMRPVLLARKSVVDNLQQDANLALKFLQRKLKREFSTRHEIEHEGEVKTTDNPILIGIAFDLQKILKNENPEVSTAPE